MLNLSRKKNNCTLCVMSMWSFSGGMTLKCCSSKLYFYKFQKIKIYIKLRCYPIIFMSKKSPFHALPRHREKTSIYDYKIFICLQNGNESIFFTN